VRHEFKIEELNKCVVQNNYFGFNNSASSQLCAGLKSNFKQLIRVNQNG
jgi:hypothetical protein